MERADHGQAGKNLPLTRFTRSIRSCIFRNFGMAMVTSTPMSSKRIPTATPMIQPIPVWVEATLITPPMPRIGAYSTMRSSMTLTI